MSLLSSVLFLVCVQDPSAGVQKFAAGDFPGAMTAFGEAAKKAPDLAALQYDLAVAAFRAQDLAAAEEAIERYAALPSGGRADLHHGMLGNIRYRQAEARANAAVGAPPAMPLQSQSGASSPAAEPKDPVAELEAAVQLAEAARAAFVRAACAKEAGPEVARNTERAVRLREQLKKQLEEAKKQRDDQQKQDGDQQKDDQKQDQKNNDQKKNDEQKSDPSKSGDEQKPEDPSKDDEQSKQEQEPPKDGASRPEPKPEDQQGKENQEGKQEPQPAEPEGQKDRADAPNKDGDAAPEPKGDGAPKPEPEKPAGDEQSQAAASEAARSDAPGERPAGTELSPEQQARMMEQLKELDQRLRQIRAAARSGRRPVERDW